MRSKGTEPPKGRLGRKNRKAVEGKEGDVATTHESAGAARRPFFGFLVVFALICAIGMPMAIALDAAGIFYTPIAKTLHVSSGVTSYYTSFLWGAGLIALPFMGKMLDHVDSRVCVAGSCAVIAIDFVWLSFATELWMYFLGAFVMGFGVVMLNLMAPSTIINRWFVERAGFFVGLVMAFAGVGGLVFSTLGGWLILEFGWQATYRIFACVCAATVPICWFCIRSYPKDKGLEPYGLAELEAQEARQGDGSSGQAVGGSAEDCEDEGITAKEAYHTLAFPLIMALAFLMNFCMYTYYIIPSYVDSLSVGAAWPMLGAMAASTAMGAQIASKLGMGALSSKIPYLGTIVCIAIGATGVLTLCFLGPLAAVFVFAGAALYGIFHGTTNVMLPEFSEFSFGRAHYAHIYSRISMAACAGNLATGFIWGTVIRLTGSYTIVFSGIACLMAVAICVVLLLKLKTKRLSPS